MAATEASSQSTAAILPQIDFNAFVQRGTNTTDRSATNTQPQEFLNLKNNNDGIH